MALEVNGVLHGTGDRNLILIDGMFVEEGTGNIPSTFLLPVSGSYVGCSRVGSDTLYITNPSTNIGSFSFPVYWTIDESTWYTTQLTGISYKSLGGIDITTSAIRNAIGESSNSVGVLCASSLVNRYAEYCPDANSPHPMGDFRWYAHATPGGASVRATKSDDPVGWGDTVTINGFMSRVYKEISGKPYSQSKVELYEGASLRAASAEVNLNTTYGAKTTYDKQNPYDTTTTVTWYVKTSHYYGSAWVEGASESFTIEFSGSPFAYVFGSDERNGEDLTVNFTHNGALEGYSIRLRVIGLGTQSQLCGASPESITYTDPQPIPENTNWVLEVDYNGNWVTLGNGSV